MKKLLLSVILIPFTVFSQMPEKEVKETFEEILRLEKTAFKQFDDKDINGAEKTCLSIIEIFGTLPDISQEGNKHLLANAYYNLSCAYALNGQKKKALEALENAVNSSYNDFRHTLKDDDLASIRKDKKFNELIDRMRDTGDYIRILKKDHDYRTEETGEYPKFTYQSQNDWNIKNVKQYFNLDSVAGSGDEISQIMNLLSWVHNTIPHDGSHRPFCEMDAIDIYNYSKASGRGVNCRFLAITLNECYLAMGFKSRFVTCMPKDKDDGDCHVINCVYSETLYKWVWADPTFNAYLKDENGVLLSIEEVRDRLVNDQPIILNDDANWNNKVTQTKERYIDNYMAKNLYWLNCTSTSAFNIESDYRPKTDKYIALIPSGYEVGEWYQHMMQTNDPSYFWQKPE